MWLTIRSSMLVGGAYRLGADFSGFVPPLGIKVIVAYVESGGGEGAWWENGYVMAAIVLVAALAQSTCSQASTFLVNSEGIHIKVALQALIYKKALRLPSSSGSCSSASTQHKNEQGFLFEKTFFPKTKIKFSKFEIPSFFQ
jgi:hypothetical protein